MFVYIRSAAFVIVVTQKLVLQQSKNVTAKCTETLSPPPSIQFSLRITMEETMRTFTFLFTSREYCRLWRTSNSRWTRVNLNSHRPDPLYWPQRHAARTGPTPCTGHRDARREPARPHLFPARF